MVFSAVKAHQFFAEESWDSFKQIFDTYMNEASKVKEVLSNGGAMVVLRGGNLKKRHRIAVAGLQWRCHGGRHSHGAQRGNAAQNAARDQERNPAPSSDPAHGSHRAPSSDDPAACTRDEHRHTTS
ncbi:hypothetical protein HKD37_10G029824 [Glycine soja]